MPTLERLTSCRTHDWLQLYSSFHQAATAEGAAVVAKQKQRDDDDERSPCAAIVEIKRKCGSMHTQHTHTQILLPAGHSLDKIAEFQEGTKR